MDPLKSFNLRSMDMTKVYYFIPLFILILALLLSCTTDDLSKPINRTANNSESRVHQKATSILYMSDLEIIKKSADYIKSIGKNLTFEETKIQYSHSPNPRLLCKNHKGEDIYHSGEYLVIYFYPHAQIQKSENILAIFIGDNGTVLGYMDELSE